MEELVSDVCDSCCSCPLVTAKGDTPWGHTVGTGGLGIQPEDGGCGDYRAVARGI